MVNYIYLGYGVTDSNGVAKLDHDANGDPISHSYTGTGAGEIDIVASLDNPIGEGSIQSEISVEDCVIYSTQTYSTSSSTKSEIINGFTFPNFEKWEVSADTQVTANAMRWEIGVDSGYKYMGVGINGSGYVRAFQGNGSNGEVSTSTHGSFTKNQFIPVKIIRDGTSINYYYDGNLIETLSCDWISSVSSFPLTWNRWGSNGTLSIKNLKVKPL